VIRREGSSGVGLLVSLGRLVRSRKRPHVAVAVVEEADCIRSPIVVVVVVVSWSLPPSKIPTSTHDNTPWTNPILKPLTHLQLLVNLGHVRAHHHHHPRQTPPTRARTPSRPHPHPHRPTPTTTPTHTPPNTHLVLHLPPAVNRNGITSVWS
jgi:hypothetical protein